MHHWLIHKKTVENADVETNEAGISMSSDS